MMTAFAPFVGCFAAVALSNVKIQQRYPWNGKVDISFKFNSTRSNNTVRITAIDRSTGERLNVVNLFDENGTQLYAPIKMAPGEHRIVWDADKDLEAGFRTESLAVTVSVGKYFEYLVFRFSFPFISCNGAFFVKYVHFSSRFCQIFLFKFLTFLRKRFSRYP